jgi:hypothetical protein
VTKLVEEGSDDDITRNVGRARHLGERKSCALAEAWFLLRVEVMRTLSILIVLLAGLATASAGKTAGVTMPDTTRVAGKQLVLNGMGLREATWLNIDVYVAGLYVETPSSDAAKLIAAPEVKVLVLRFVRHVGRGDILKAWREGFAGNATVPLARIQPLIDQLNRWTPAFDDGDTLTFSYVPGTGVEVSVNGVRKGTIDNDDFERSVFAIWLGPKPPTAAVKRGLLGNHGAGR